VIRAQVSHTPALGTHSAVGASWEVGRAVPELCALTSSASKKEPPRNEEDENACKRGAWKVLRPVGCWTVEKRLERMVHLVGQSSMVSSGLIA